MLAKNNFADPVGPTLGRANASARPVPKNRVQTGPDVSLNRSQSGPFPTPTRSFSTGFLILVLSLLLRVSAFAFPDPTTTKRLEFFAKWEVLGSFGKPATAAPPFDFQRATESAKPCIAMHSRARTRAGDDACPARSFSKEPRRRTPEASHIAPARDSTPQRSRTHAHCRRPAPHLSAEISPHPCERKGERALIFVIARVRATRRPARSATLDVPK
jgi:hypothetical protein